MKEREEIFFDFGFTVEDEEDILAKSELKYDVVMMEDRIKSVEAHLIKMNAYVHDVYNKVLPLLNNLAKDADKKPIINWPNRKEKIVEFQETLLQVVQKADKLMGEI